MSEVDRMSLAIVAACFAIVVVPIAAVPLFAREPSCGDYVAAPGATCRDGRTLVVESGVAVCRCPVKP